MTAILASAIRYRLQQIATIPATELSPRLRGALVGVFNKRIGDLNRKLVWGWLFRYNDKRFEPLSSKALTDGECAALVGWIDWWKDADTNTWLYSERFEHELPIVLTEAVNAYNELNRVDKHPFEREAEYIDTFVSLDGQITAILPNPNNDEVEPQISRRPTPLLSGTKFGKLLRQDKKEIQDGRPND